MKICINSVLFFLFAFTGLMGFTQNLQTDPGKRQQVRPGSTVNFDTVNALRLQKDDKFVLYNIYFEPGMHEIKVSSYPVIKEIVRFLRKNKRLKIEIQGHICCDTIHADGLDITTNKFELSDNRAKAVYTALTFYGINSTRLKYKGYGGKKRIVQVENTQEDQDLNRRVEIWILETGRR
jgi:outer membrane protein OmpA-like peptidoglycan-associated protein